ncbi:MAG: hypothetical protein HZC43_09345 [Nitrosomonadales bacterium]|nr:hypothetical protein [Nitrosomonadales bacterium]
MLLYLLGWLEAQPVLADIDPADYALKSSVRSEKERQRLQAEFDADKKREAELQKQEEEIEARRLAAEKTDREALPYPVRLTLARCTMCHISDYYSNLMHNRIGWELVNLRMQYWNDAPLNIPGAPLKIQTPSRYCVAQEILTLTYQTYAAR